MIDRLEILRREFDDGFARAAGERIVKTSPHLRLRAGSLQLAIPIGEVRAIETGTSGSMGPRSGGTSVVVPLPGARPGLRGLIGVRGQLVPVYALGDLLGAGSASYCRWFLITAGEKTAALAFEEFGGLIGAPADAVRPLAGSGPPHARATLEMNGTTCWVIHLPELIGKLAEESTT